MTTRPTATLLAFAAAGLLTLGAAPAGRYTVTTDTVSDTATGLVWQRGGETLTYSWISAISYCRNLRLAATSGWRLPTAKELQTLVDERATAIRIDSTAFPSATSGFFWSSTPVAATPDKAWGVDFASGEATSRSTGGGYPVRCVR